MIIKASVILWIFFIFVNEGITVGHQYKVLKKLLYTIDRRLKRNSGDIFELRESIIHLNQSCNGNIEEKVNSLERTVNRINNQSAEYSVTLNNFESKISDENQIKIYKAKMEEELQTLERTVNGIKNQSAEYAVTLNNFKSKISDEIQKIKQDLAAEPSCPPDWSQFLGYCYHLNTTKTDIDTAVKTCSNSSAFVVDIESEVELQFVKSLTDEWIWVGITDRKEEGNWTLLRNGQQMKFSNWDNGQPNNFYNGNDEGCAVMYTSGLWHDYQCSSRFAFTCKKIVSF